MFGVYRNKSGKIMRVHKSMLVIDDARVYGFQRAPFPLIPIILPSLCLAVRSLGFGRDAATATFTASAAAGKIHKIRVAVI